MKRWWIHEPIILGSDNPTTDQLKDLYQEGFRSIISLLDENNQSPNYDVKEVESMGFKRHSIPLKDFSTPTLPDFWLFLWAVHQALDQGKVLVHCQEGSGRTGTMATAYWINKGLSAEETIKKVRQSKPNAIDTDQQKRSLYELEACIASPDPKLIEAVCFDFRGVIVDHKNDKDLIPGIDKLLMTLKANGLRLAIVSSFSSEFVRSQLGSLHLYFDDNIYNGSKEGKLDCIKKFAGKCGIGNLSKIAFVDDKPENLRAVALHSNVYVIAFRGSGKYPHTPQVCKEHGIPFAESVKHLSELLSV